MSDDGALPMARTCPDAGIHRHGRADLAARPGLRAQGGGEAGVQLPLQAQVEGEPEVRAGNGGCSSPSATGTPAGSTYMHWRPSTPRSTASYSRSSPARPTISPGGRPGQRFSSSGVATPAKPSTGPSSAPCGYDPARLRDDQHTGNRCRGHRVADRARDLGHDQRQRGARRRPELRGQVCERAAR